jgi:hypothetical protein
MLVGRHSTVLMGWRLAGIQYMRRDADNESLAIMQIMIEVADESLLGARETWTLLQYPTRWHAHAVQMQVVGPSVRGCIRWRVETSKPWSTWMDEWLMEAVREDRVLVWWPMEARRVLPCVTS